MLVLSRKKDETIQIGDDIQVTIVDIRGENVRLGINAPVSVSVHRKEIYDQIHITKPLTVKPGGENPKPVGIRPAPPVAPPLPWKQY